MLINDYDDERTLDEEENMSGESFTNELDELEKEGDMPIDQLLAMYGCGEATGGSNGHPSIVSGSSPDDDGDGTMMSTGSGDNDGGHDSTRSSSESEILENNDLTLDKDEIARDLLANNGPGDDTETTVTDLLHAVSSSSTARLLRSNSRPGSEASSDSEEDVDYLPENDEDGKKMIQVGHDYQATVPEGLSLYGDAPAYENEDRLLWDPTKIDDEKLEAYLRDVHAQTMMNAVGVGIIPTGCHVRDDEQALYLLLQCGHNIEEALRRRKMQAVPPSDPMSLWSEEECRNFENGLRLYGKNFYLIQQNKVRTRSVGELIQFYYLWKKTERHDVFANRNRLEKRKYTLHPGVTDYMDRFLDEQENGIVPGTMPGRDRSASPLTSLIYGDPKRTHLKQDADEASAATFDPIDPQPITSIGTATNSVALMPAGASGSITAEASFSASAGASAACPSSSDNQHCKRGLEEIQDPKGDASVRGDMNGNTEDSGTSATEPVPKKLKRDKGDVGVEGRSLEQPDVAQRADLKHLDTVSLPALQVIPGSALRTADLPTSTDSFCRGSRATAESLSQ
ncbi:mesoderm induction early response protein 1-like isoform X2 [Pomacea canaliculata]|nr:mesoderm induction early response protein 1-like isoform X2 [Pomacea canaliculata]